jgi:hypothetical protein
MIAPFYTLEAWLTATLGGWGMPVFFALSLIGLPLLLAGVTAWTSRALSGAHDDLLSITTRFSYGLVPLGFSMWLAHYLFHFLTGMLTFVPVLQSFFADRGLPLLGMPNWTLGPVVPDALLLPIEILALDAGLLGSLLALHRIAKRGDGESARRAFVPWAVLAVLLFAAGVWLLLQPMDMRGTMVG